MLRGHLTPQRLLAACITAGVFALTWFSSSSDNRSRVTLTGAAFSLTITSDWEETTGDALDLTPFQASALLAPGPQAWRDDEGRIMYFGTIDQGNFDAILPGWQTRIDANWEPIEKGGEDDFRRQTVSGVFRNGAGSVHLGVSAPAGFPWSTVVTCLSPRADDKECPRILDSIRAPDTRD